MRDESITTSTSSSTNCPARWPIRRWSALQRSLRLKPISKASRQTCECGGERAAVIYTLLGTAKLNGLNPQVYLRFVLQRIADHPVNRMDELLPWVVAGQINTAIVEQRLAA